jgi:hypothetical protein
MTGNVDDSEELAAQKSKRRRSIQKNLAEEALNIYGSHISLNASEKDIRLLSLHDSEDENAPLIGELHLATLDDDYTALSYVWGDELKRRPIRLNSFDTTITANLRIVLKQLRDEKKARNIWIDAVCS